MVHYGKATKAKVTQDLQGMKSGGKWSWKAEGKLGVYSRHLLIINCFDYKVFWETCTQHIWCFTVFVAKIPQKNCLGHSFAFFPDSLDENMRGSAKLESAYVWIWPPSKSALQSPIIATCWRSWFNSTSYSSFSTIVLSPILSNLIQVSLLS